MDYNKDNKMPLFICVSLVLLAVIFAIIYNEYNSSSEYSNKDDAYLRNYKVNEVVKVYITEEDMAKKYLADFVNYVLNDPEKAYTFVSDDKFDSYESFEEYLKVLVDNDFVKSVVKEFNTYYKDKVKYYDIVIGNSKHIIFKENSIMDYNVSFK